MLPCVVQVGFSGSRKLFDPPPATQQELDDLHAKVQAELVRHLSTLLATLELKNHFLCGISQIAIGADTIFARACQQADIVQRIFLPQSRDVFFAAGSEDGTPDFSRQERGEAKALLKSAHIIQERVVSNADDRMSRFEDCNREIVRVSDVVICLIRAGATGSPAGASQMLAHAIDQGRKCLELRVEPDGTVKPRWHEPAEWDKPALPEALDALSIESHPGPWGVTTLPGILDFCSVLKEYGKVQAKLHNRLFGWTVRTIIITHVLATLCATIALAFHRGGEAAHHAASWIALLLGVELVLLLVGYAAHRWLHYADLVGHWAIARLVGEISRSVTALGKLHLYPSYLFRMRLRPELRWMLRTINVLHLHSTRRSALLNWDELKPERDAYLIRRVLHQIAYYSGCRDREEILLRVSNFLFSWCAFFAIASTWSKLVLVRWIDLPREMEWIAVLGSMAIFLPTLAVGILSWAAAMEYRARVEDYGGMVTLLKAQQKQLEKATSVRELRQLVAATEMNLMGEVAEWYARRRTTEVT